MRRCRYWLLRAARAASSALLNLPFADIVAPPSRKLAVRRPILPTAAATARAPRRMWTDRGRAPAAPAGPALGVQRGLFLSRGERPGGAGAALLAEHEAQLRRRFQLRLVRTEGRARLLERERAQEVRPGRSSPHSSLCARRVWARACSCMLATCNCFPPLLLEVCDQDRDGSDHKHRRRGRSSVMAQIAEKTSRLRRK